MASKFYKAGGFATDTVTDIIMLRALVTTSGRVSSFRRNTGTAGYAVTSGKTFYISMIKVAASPGDAVDYDVGIGFSDTDLGFDVTTARTNPVICLGNPEAATAALCRGLSFQPSLSEGKKIQTFGYDNMIIPCTGSSAKYLYTKVFHGGFDVEVQIWGFEV